MKLQILVTTMHQSSFDIYKKMNLQSDAVIANQADKNSYCEDIIDGHKVKLVTTDSRGLSRNRNIAMSFSSQDADCYVFSDDDLVFTDGYEKMILEEFEKHPEADALKFNIHDLSSVRQISMKRIERFEKATRRNMSSSGVCALAVKREVLKNLNLHFNENFGAGTENSSGEDTIFLMEMLDKGVKLYRSPVDIAGIDQTESSWFKGFTESYFRNLGRILHACYPKLACLLAVRGAYRFSKRKECKIGFCKILKNYLKGIRDKY